MYFLKRDPRLLESQELARERIQDAIQRLEDSTVGLTFDPGPHKYSFYGRPMASVSDIVKHYAPFDTRTKAIRASKNPKHEYFGYDVEEIIRLWDLKRDNAAAAGTRIHAFAEACFLYMLNRENEIEEAYRDRITSEGLAAEDPKEVSAARWWAEYDWSSYAVVAKETRIVNPQRGYAGTFDILLYGLRDDGYHMRDYKSNEDLYKWYGDMLRPPLNVLKANDIGKYTLQQTAYTIELRNIGLKMLTNELIWLRENGYENKPLEMRYDKIVDYAIAQLKL